MRGVSPRLGVPSQPNTPQAPTYRATSAPSSHQIRGTDIPPHGAVPQPPPSLPLIQSTVGRSQARGGTRKMSKTTGSGHSPVGSSPRGLSTGTVRAFEPTVSRTEYEEVCRANRRLSLGGWPSFVP
ncbi:hypothetical protein KIPB_012020 [Kipferlia bialata]|uniref:Uncharacterized protein n=1 Tax=Kipferlia bialata TaxID=797122 RepID=A0A9K3D7A3_9EUKA|nr:hypothetical protein KIPB_012020 [Kipferlia bialata]|eukprot:g12020.t1